MTPTPRTAEPQTFPSLSADAPPAPVPLTKPLVSIVIVNYRQWRSTARLVRQLLASPEVRRGRFEIVVVDNHSPRHPLRRRLRRTTGVSLRCLKQNRGFGRGVNEGCRLSRGDWFLLLNPDVTVGPGWLDRLLAYLQREPPARTGVIGLQLRDPGGAIQGSIGRSPTLFGTLLGQARSRPVRKCRVWPGRAGGVPWVAGCGLLVRRRCFEQLGGLDPAFFLYYEDADFCRRARAAGWRVHHEPGLCLVHHHPLHGRALTPRMRLLTRYALLTYARKHWQAASYLALAGIVWLEALARSVPASKKRDRSMFRTTRQIAVDHLLGRIGRAYRRIWRIAQASARRPERERPSLPR